MDLVLLRVVDAMRSIAVINEGSTVRKMLDHLGESTRPPRSAPARGPPLWQPLQPNHPESDRLLAPPSPGR